MNQFDTLFENPETRKAAIGLGLAVAIPGILILLAPHLRPLARQAVKGGLLAVERGKEMAARAAEDMDDLMAEVQDELRAERMARGAGEGAGGGGFDGSGAARSGVGPQGVDPDATVERAASDPAPGDSPGSQAEPGR